MFKKFETNDIIYNTVISHPEFSFYIQRNKVYLNNEFEVAGTFSNKIKHVPQGHISVHEINVNRPASDLIYPFITKEGARIAFKTVTTSQFDDSAQFRYGDTIKGKYPLSASISRVYLEQGSPFKQHDSEGAVTFSPSASKKYILAMKTQFDRRPLGFSSNNFNYDNYEQSEVNMICVPSIFYGSQFKKGSVELNYYISGTLTATLKDEKYNGEMIQTYGLGSGSVAGLVFYDVGIITLTGSWDLSAIHKEKFLVSSEKVTPKWTNYGTGIPIIGKQISPTDVTGSSCLVNFRGTNKIPVLTMLAHSEEGEHNFSHNTTFIDKDSKPMYEIESGSYREISGKVKNIKKSQFKGHKEKFEKITYISKIGIYDEQKNLIAVATLANPVKKREGRDFTFKLRMDF